MKVLKLTKDEYSKLSNRLRTEADKIIVDGKVVKGGRRRQS